MAQRCACAPVNDGRSARLGGARASSAALCLLCSSLLPLLEWPPCAREGVCECACVWLGVCVTHHCGGHTLSMVEPAVVPHMRHLRRRRTGAGPVDAWLGRPPSQATAGRGSAHYSTVWCSLRRTCAGIQALSPTTPWQPASPLRSTVSHARGGGGGAARAAACPRTRAHPTGKQALHAGAARGVGAAGGRAARPSLMHAHHNPS